MGTRRGYRQGLMPDVQAADPNEQPAAPRPPDSTQREVAGLGARLNQVANGLFWLAGIVFALTVIGTLIVASTTFDTFGLIDPNAESQSRSVVEVALLAAGITAGGILTGLAGILKALVRQDVL